jgi:hypothetical protein
MERNFILVFIYKIIMSIGGARKAIVLPLVSLASAGDKVENFDGDGPVQQRGGGAKTIIASIVHLAIGIFAGWLAWTCNSGSSTVVRVLYTLVGVVFSWIYLIYYAIYHKLMGNACMGPGATMSATV